MTVLVISKRPGLGGELCSGAELLASTSSREHEERLPGTPRIHLPPFGVHRHEGISMTDTTAQRSAAIPSLRVATASAAGIRLREIDMLRGLVIVLMALDHVRDYFHSARSLQPARSRAHDCGALRHALDHASVRADLRVPRRRVGLPAGGQGQADAALSRFLLSRGLWLVALELTVVSFGWSFALPYPLLPAGDLGDRLVDGRAGRPGVAAARGGARRRDRDHRGAQPARPADAGPVRPFALVWIVPARGRPLFVGDAPVGFVSYPVLPWIGVIALGYGPGAMFLDLRRSAIARLLLLGTAMIALFILLRGIQSLRRSAARGRRRKISCAARWRS